MIVSNASPLIYFARVGRMDLLLKLFGKIILEEEVRREVVDSGKKEGYADATLVEEFILKGSIDVRRIRKPMEMRIGLHIGEINTIALARELKCKDVLIDEEDARAVARVFGLTPRGCLYVLKQSVDRKFISDREAIETLNSIVSSGFRLSAKYYLEFLKSLNEQA